MSLKKYFDNSEQIYFELNENSVKISTNSIHKV